MTIAVLIADDNALVRDALMSCFLAEPDMSVVAAVSDGQQAVDLAVRSRPDVIVMDVRMPVLDGVAATLAILSCEPRIRVLIFTGVGQRSVVRDAFAAGASGYLLKEGDPAAVIEAVRTRHAGGTVLREHLGQMLGT